MRRGGALRRYVSLDDVPVTCAERWGPKRVRVTQCWAALTAEDVYARLMRDELSAMRPGAFMSATRASEASSVRR